MLQLMSAGLLGLIGGSVPGPMLASAFTESLNKGFLRSLRVIFWAMASETLVAIFLLAAFFSFRIPQAVFSVISFLGAVVVVWLATQVYRIRGFNETGDIFSFSKIFLLTVLNGPFWIFWITICIPQAFSLRRKIAGGHIFFLILNELGWLFATVFWTFLFSRFRPLLSQGKLVSKSFKAIALILLFFAGKLLFESFELIPR
jgi:threonine/homoserine/homoserine lactone efflux protein